MKTDPHYQNRALLILLLLIGLGCAVTKSVDEPSPTRGERDPNVVIPTDHDRSPQAWDNLFRRVPGLQVSGAYPNLLLRIRGASSLNLTTSPLFVVDGVPLGHDFDSLNRAVIPADVASIRVLKGSDASLYGVRGANGVIEIKLKN